jgi:hypothetical protein
MDPRRALLPAVGVLGLLAVAAVAAIQADEDAEQAVRAGSGGTTTTVEEPTTTTTATTATTVVATTTTTLAAPAPTTVTTARPTTTTVAAPARSWSISPTSGPSASRFTAAGSGCVGQNAGVALSMHDPSGQPFNGDGAAALPDGTWRLDTSLGAVPPGRYTVKAACQGSSPFQYPQVHAFTVTG